ncbi:unnamed protein product [Callosobruchus maculatus]|uniref:Uncharacterized protein n=1 Tax=Callosobruchus maculatus TaxID=64391 RepID=A0A653BU80_CALMS|nr:unnamed protein product [Callosobruchus maculatus]
MEVPEAQARRYFGRFHQVELHQVHHRQEWPACGEARTQYQSQRACQESGEVLVEMREDFVFLLFIYQCSFNQLLYIVVLHFLK